MRQESLYVLRLWREGDLPEAWRVSLEDVRSREKVSFNTLTDLYRFLQGRCDLRRSGEPLR